MNRVVEPTRDFNVAVSVAVEKDPSVRSAEFSDAQLLDTLLNESIPKLSQLVTACCQSKATESRVDGLIIGTGEADFTKGNVLYRLNFNDKVFQLVDVPGIEGDESKYASLVQAAVAKAHLVFYVNGTNKKPEKATAEKIRSYLSRGSQVCPLVNVRGSADAYEFDEDRECLQQGNASSALTQTVEVLGAALGAETLLPGHCVQGLLGFSSLSFNGDEGVSTIHPSRDRDLLIQQRNYLKFFKTSDEMYKFSQIQNVADVLHGKLDTFKEDIIESNKLKVSELLYENITVLDGELSDYRDFLKKLKPEFERCRKTIDDELKKIEKISLNQRNNSVNELFTQLMDGAEEIVKKNFGDEDSISRKIKISFDKLQVETEGKINRQHAGNIKELKESLHQALVRLIEDIQRVEFQQAISANESPAWSIDQGSSLGWDLGVGDFGSILLQIGSYAASGAAIGFPFGGIGAPIGAAIGALVGTVMAVVSLFMSKERRIRKAQAKVREKIDEVRKEKLDAVEFELEKMIASVKSEVKASVLAQVDKLHTDIEKPLAILEQQILLMNNVKNKLDGMPYGTVQAI